MAAFLKKEKDWLFDRWLLHQTAALCGGVSNRTRPPVNASFFQALIAARPQSRAVSLVSLFPLHRLAPFPPSDSLAVNSRSGRALLPHRCTHNASPHPI